MPEQQNAHSGLEIVGEVTDLAVGLGMIVMTLFPFALPALALSALVALVLMVPMLVGAVLVAPLLMLRSWRRSHARAHSTGRLAGDGETAIPWPAESDRAQASLGGPDALDLGVMISHGPGSPLWLHARLGRSWCQACSWEPSMRPADFHRAASPDLSVPGGRATRVDDGRA